MPRVLKRVGGTVGPLVAVLLISVTVVAAQPAKLPAPARPDRSTHRVYTILDYFEQGRQAVDAFLATPELAAGDLARVIQRCQAACVRLRMPVEQAPGVERSTSASGVLIDRGRRVLTAGHVLDGQGARISVILSNGELRQARLVGSEYAPDGDARADWAVLELIGPPVDSIPAVAIADGRPAEIAFILGYPNEVGVDVSGRLVFAGSAASQAVKPLVTLGVIERASPLLIVPHVGSIPTPGMSGGPIFDRAGRLIGLFSSIGRTSDGTEVSFTYHAASLEALRGKRWSRNRGADGE